MNDTTRKIEVLKVLADRRDEALATLQSAFPHGRPEGYAKGYDDRHGAWKELDRRCDELSQVIFAELAE